MEMLSMVLKILAVLAFVNVVLIPSAIVALSIPLRLDVSVLGLDIHVEIVASGGFVFAAKTSQ